MSQVFFPEIQLGQHHQHHFATHHNGDHRNASQMSVDADNPARSRRKPQRVQKPSFGLIHMFCPLQFFPKFIKNKIYEIQELKHNNDEYDSQQI